MQVKYQNFLYSIIPKRYFLRDALKILSIFENDRFEKIKLKIDKLFRTGVNYLWNDFRYSFSPKSVYTPYCFLARLLEKSSIDIINKLKWFLKVPFVVSFCKFLKSVVS